MADGDWRALSCSLEVKPSRERTIRETVVVIGAKGDGGRPFSESSEAVDEESHQATEKG